MTARNGHMDILRKLILLGIEIDDRDSVSELLFVVSKLILVIPVCVCV